MYKSEIIQVLQDEAIKHPVINSTNYGAEFDVNINGKDTYPLFFVESEASQISIDANANTHTLALYFLDKHTEDDKATIVEKQALMERVMLEFHYYLYQGFVNNLSISGTTTNALSLYEFESDILAGWRMEIEVITSNPIVTCDIKNIFSGNMSIELYEAS